MRILAVSADYFASPDEPGCPRFFCLMRELAKRHQISFVTTRQTGDRMRGSSAHSLLNCFHRASFVNELEKSRWWARKLHNFSLRSHMDLRIRSPQFVTAFNEVIAQAVRETGSDVVLARGLQGHCIVPFDLSVPVVVDIVDSLSLLHRRLAELASKRRLRWEHYLEAYGMYKLEQEVLCTRAASLYISDVDARHINSELEDKIFVVPNGVDVHEPDHDIVTCEDPTIVFSGVMNYDPNADAALRLAREIFPYIRERISNAALQIVGAEPIRCVQGLAQLPGVNVTGTVPVLREYLERGHLFISPIRVGSGLKNKILQAMACRVPVIASPISMEGIDAVAGRDYLSAESNEDFVRSAVLLLESRELADEVALNGYSFVKQNYQWSTQAQKLEQILLSLTEAKQ